eukprot:12591848-Alexandrium_andersonii.AAC.1
MGEQLLLQAGLPHAERGDAEVLGALLDVRAGIEQLLNDATLPEVRETPLHLRLHHVSGDEPRLLQQRERLRDERPVEARPRHHLLDDHGLL